MSHPDANRSPRLDALLSRLRQSLVRQVWLHGLGTFAAVLGGWLLFAFLADYLLHVPAAIRVFHALVLVGLPAWFLSRELFAHLKHIPDRSGLARLIERRNPELNELFVSAVQLAPQAEQSASRELIQHVVQEAEERTPGIDLATVVDPKRPRRRCAFGVGVALFTTAALLFDTGLSSIFFRRMFGGDASWPQRTHLYVEIPIVGERAQVEPIGDPVTEIRVRVARGSDIPVLVRAEGVVPEEVTLHFKSGHTAVLTSGGTPLFRELLPSVQQDTEFFVTGGDDDSGSPVVQIAVLQPPDVEGIAVRIEPPAYSGLAPRTELDADVEVLQGSRITVHVLPDPPNARGIARILPEDREIALASAPFPGTDEADPREGLAFDLIADQTVRYRFELVDESGLPNPDPGLFGIQVVEDRRPEVLLLSPGRAEVDVVPGGALALRVRVEDDFGIASVEWAVRASQDAAETLAGDALETHTIRPVEDEYKGRRRAVQAARTRLEVDELAGDLEGAVGGQLVLQIEARDNREPEANKSPSAPVRLRIVSSDEFLRRLQDNLARAGEQAGRLSRLQEEKVRRTREILAALQSDDLQAGDLVEVSALVTGERRVQGDARALARDLASIAESLLYSRVDERAGPLLEALDDKLADYTDRSFHPEPWRELATLYADKQLGTAGLAGQLVSIVGLALEISEDHTRAAADALTRAQETSGPAGVQAAVAESYDLQMQAMERIDRLLEQLAGWDNYQSVLTQLRDALNGQKNLMERTRQFAKDH